MKLSSFYMQSEKLFDQNRLNLISGTFDFFFQRTFAPHWWKNILRGCENALKIFKSSFHRKESNQIMKT